MASYIKCQRTGLTEGSLLYNNWLKTKNLYSRKTEDEFINWLYSSAGWYDKSISGTYFDIDTDEVRESPIYNRFLKEFQESLANSTHSHIMLHSDFHVPALHLKDEYLAHFSLPQDHPYWMDKDFLTPLLQHNAFIINAFAPLIEEKYKIPGMRTPFTFFNNGPHQNSFETLDDIISQIPLTFDTYFVSAGPYGCFITDYLYTKHKKTALTVGSGLHHLLPVEITDEYKPDNYTMIEGGRYWNYTK